MPLNRQVKDFTKTWEKIKPTIEATLRLDHSVDRATWQDCLYEIHDLCCATPKSLATELYRETKRLLKTHVQQSYEEIISKEINESENALLKYQRYWERFCEGADRVNMLYGFLNKHGNHVLIDEKYRMKKSEVGELPEIGELATDKWMEVTIPPLIDKVILKMTGKEVPWSSTPELDNKSFLNSFEQPFLVKMGDYYKQEASILLQEFNCSQYMEKVVARLKDEEVRFQKYLTMSTYVKVYQLAKQKMGTDHKELLLEDCENIIRQEKTEDIANMYTLLKGDNHALTVMVQKLQVHIYDEGLRATSNLSRVNMSTQFVESLLEVHGKFVELIDAVLNGEAQFLSALEKGLVSAVNHREPKSHCIAPELLARHCDKVLRSAQGKTGDELHDQLNSLIMVFKCIDDKDVFLTFYSRMLLRRLIDGLSWSSESEEAMIEKLKQTCGYEFTSNLRRMFTDVGVSADLNGKFDDFVKTRETVVDLGVRFHVYVLQAGAWPHTHVTSTFTFPRELEKSLQMFKLFYNQQFTGRKLTWLAHLCTGEVKLNYVSKPCVAIVSTYHMGILLAFNNSDTLAYRELLDCTGMNEEKLRSTVKSLLDAKILDRKNSEREEIESTFSLNMHFTSKRTKFRIASTSAQKNTAREVEQVRCTVDEDRKHYLQAAIVRIMKARKVLRFNDLIQEVIGQSKARFNPSIGMIKKCMEVLIDQEYIERSQSLADEYSYMA